MWVLPQRVEPEGLCKGAVLDLSTQGNKKFKETAELYVTFPAQAFFVWLILLSDKVAHGDFSFRRHSREASGAC